MMILLVGKRRTPATSGRGGHLGARGITVPPSSACGAVGLASPTTAPPPSARAADIPLGEGVVRATMMGNLPMGKHVVGDVDSASREGDATVQRHMQKDFDHLLLGEA